MRIVIEIDGVEIARVAEVAQPDVLAEAVADQLAVPPDVAARAAAIGAETAGPAPIGGRGLWKGALELGDVLDAGLAGSNEGDIRAEGTTVEGGAHDAGPRREHPC